MSIKNEIPIVSVIIPTYNREDLIKDAVESVLSQSFTSFEVIVVDDGSTDKTSEIFKSITDSRVIYINLLKNKGRSFARNEALNIAKGKYIAFLDSDDLYLPNKLKLQVEYLENNPEISMVYTHANCIDLIRNIKANYHATESGRIYEKIAFFLPVTIILPTVMVRREVFQRVGGFDIQMDRFEDTDMWRRISKDHLLYALPEYTCLIRSHNDNTLINQNPKKIVDSIHYYIDKILKDNHLDNNTMLKGIRNLFNYYIDALNTVPSFKPFAKELQMLYNDYDRKLTPPKKKWSNPFKRLFG